MPGLLAQQGALCRAPAFLWEAGNPSLRSPQPTSHRGSRRRLLRCLTLLRYLNGSPRGAFPSHSPALQSLPLLGGSLQTTLALLELPQQGCHLGFHGGLVLSHLLREKKPLPVSDAAPGQRAGTKTCHRRASLLPPAPLLTSPLTSRSFSKATVP